MTTFQNLPALAARPFAVARRVLEVASDAIDEVGLDAEMVGRRYVSPVPPQWTCPLLAVYQARRSIGQAGSEQFGYPLPLDPVLGLHNLALVVVLVLDGAPVTDRAPAGRAEQAAERAAERLMLGTAAIFHGLIQAHESGQIEDDYHLMLTGPDDPHPLNEAGFVGHTVSVAYQLF